MQAIITEYYNKLYANNTDNVEEMDKFLEKHNLPKLNQKEIENLNKSTTKWEIETNKKNLPTNKSPGSDGFKGEFYQQFTEELTPILWDHHHPDPKTRKLCHNKKKTTGQYHWWT